MSGRQHMADALDHKFVRQVNINGPWNVCARQTLPPAAAARLCPGISYSG